MSNDNETKASRSAAYLGGLGGVRGGPARAKRMSSNARSLSAKKAAYSKWGKDWTQELEDEFVAALAESPDL